MFYYPNVLQRHTGCFSTICQKIMEYILQQVPAPYPGSPIPRLSLYLSAQLSYGVVCVYHRQCDLLLDEMKNILDGLHRAERQLKIDILHSEQQSLIPDALVRMEMLEDAPNPFFGMMTFPSELPDPFMIPQVRQLLEAPSPEISRLDKTLPKWRRERKHEEGDHVSSQESITMQDVEPVILPAVEFGQDLPEITAHDLEFLMSVVPAFPEEETIPEPRKREKTKPSDARERPKAKPKEADADREPSAKREDQMEISEREAEKERDHLAAVKKEREYIEMLETEIEHLRASERQSLHQEKAEQEVKAQQKTKKEKQHDEETEREKKRLRKAVEEIKRLTENGADAGALREKAKEIAHLKKLQKEREKQWKAEKEAERIKEYEREIARKQEAEREREWLRAAVEEIERLKKDLEKRDRKKEEKMDIVDESADGPRVMEAEPLTPRLSPITRLPSDVLPKSEAAIVVDDITREPKVLFPEITPEHRTPEFTSPLLPPMQPSTPQLILPDISPTGLRRSPLRHVVKKPHLIIDKETQIDSHQMQEQIKTPQVHTQAVVPVAARRLKFRTLASLFNAPTNPHWMAPELVSLWSRCAVLEERRVVQEQEASISELEAVREGAESVVGAMVSSEFSLEVSEEDRSRPLYLTPEEKESVPSQDERLLPVVPEMPELIVELPEVEEILIEDLLRNLFSQIESYGQTDFLSVAPHSLSRLLVSMFFYSCLVLCSEEVINMEQAEPYGQIIITPGERYAHK
uniref:REC8 meiotic recombination protein n=1 Tax=Leptobrachium leishanense TaxID=445787 RepID=A0A8C5Q2K2_9ANUR